MSNKINTHLNEQSKAYMVACNIFGTGVGHCYLFTTEEHLTEGHALLLLVFCYSTNVTEQCLCEDPLRE